MTLLKERFLKFIYSGYNKDEKARQLITVLKENDIDFICYNNINYYLFRVRRSNKKWDYIMSLVNSVHSVRYEYITIDFYLIEYREMDNRVFGNLQEVSCGVIPV